LALKLAMESFHQRPKSFRKPRFSTGGGCGGSASPEGCGDAGCAGIGCACGVAAAPAAGGWLSWANAFPAVAAISDAATRPATAAAPKQRGLPKLVFADLVLLPVTAAPSQAHPMIWSPN
jgi:hypothetical protein